MLTLEQLVKMREFDRYFYKSMVIESYIDYDQDGEFREYSVQVAGKLHTFSSPKQVFEFVKSVEETIQDEDLQNHTDDTHLSEYLTYLKSHNIVQYNYILQLDSPCKQES